MNVRLNNNQTHANMTFDLSPVADPACPPVSAPALCRESAASAPARELLGARDIQSEASTEETADQLHKLKKRS